MIELALTTERVRPIFYSFRRCPYAMRARLAIAITGVIVELREVELRDKPAAMLAVSPKGMVPVLQLENGEVIDESLDIMFWALRQNDAEHWLNSSWLQNAVQLIRRNDEEFKYHLDRYKYADRYPAYSELYYRQQGELFLTDLERRLNQSQFLCGDYFALADAAILPFIRQFAAVDSDWFESSPYPAVKQWLNRFLTSKLFDVVMTKYQFWKPYDPLLFFGSEKTGVN
ncbi:MAG: glutathione S-transferase [Methylobacter sp.]|uniref:glutathione S-transferase n=1 Tax=Methylobacter sp. TaxID=2051955 RepID=UPI00272FB8FA|nr:glutathione S-transferase [Methylobacter sp.]MDP1664066.1 glutathione S-transferase [Methylobacter sp.]